MKIQCKKCGAAFPIPDHRIPATGATIKCFRCMAPIRVEGQQAAGGGEDDIFFVKGASGIISGPFGEAEVVERLGRREMQGTELVSRDGRRWEPLAGHAPFAAAAAAAGLPSEPAASAPIEQVPMAVGGGGVPLRSLALQRTQAMHTMSPGRQVSAPPAGEMGIAPLDSPMDLPAPLALDDDPLLPEPWSPDAPELPGPLGPGDGQPADLPAPYAAPQEPGLPMPYTGTPSGLTAPAAWQPGDWPAGPDEGGPRGMAPAYPPPPPDNAELPYPATGHQADLPGRAAAVYPPPAPDAGLPYPTVGQRAELPDRAQAGYPPPPSVTGGELPRPAGGRAELPARAPGAPGGPAGAPGAPLPRPGDGARGELPEPVRGGGAHRAADRPHIPGPPPSDGVYRMTAEGGVERGIDLDGITDPGAVAPDFGADDAPPLGDAADKPKTSALLRIGLPLVVAVLGAGVAMGFTSLGFFGINALSGGETAPAPRPRPRAVGTGVRRVEAPKAGTAAPEPDATDPKGGTTDPAAGTAAAAAGAASGPDGGTATPSAPAATSAQEGLPPSDSYLAYSKAIAGSRRAATGQGASDRQRCVFGLVTAVSMLRYGFDPTQERTLRETIEEASGDGQKTLECRAATAGAALAAGKLDEAQPQIESLVKEERSAMTLLLQGELLLRRKEAAGAVRVLREALLLKAGEPRVLYALAQAQSEAGQHKEAGQRYAELVERDPDHPLGLLALASVLRRGDKLGDAVRLLQRINSEERPLGPPALQARAHRLAADLLVRQGKGEDAIREMTRALAKQKGDVEILYDLAKLYYQRGQYMAAQQQFTSINTLGEPQLEASLGEIRSLLAMRKLGEANESIVKARRTWGDDPQLPYYQGVLLEERGQIEQARKAYEESLKADPHFYRPTIRLARLWLRQGKKKEARRAMLKALRKNPKAAVLHDGLGDLHVTLGDLGQARASFEEALRLDPDLESARMHLASTLLELREYGASLKQFQRLQSQGNDSLDLHYGMARSYQGLRRFDEALEEYNAVLALDPDNETFAFATGSAYFEKGDYAKARERLDHALRLDSKLHRAHFLTGQSYLREGNATEAEKRFRIAIEYFRDSLEYGFWLAVALEEQGKDPEALEIYRGLERLVKGSPERISEVPDLYFRIGRNLLASGAPQRAARYLTQALGKDERRAEPWYLAGEALFQLNMYGKAAGFLREALRRKADMPGAHYRIAMCSLLQDNPNRQLATQHFRQTTQLDKENRYSDAYRQLGFLFRDSGRKGEAVKMLRRYLELAGRGAADRSAVVREIEALTGAVKRPASLDRKPDDEEDKE